MKKIFQIFNKNISSKLLAAVVFVSPGFSWAQPLTLALNWKAEPQFGGFYEAQWAGAFKKNNLEVKILEGGSGTPTAQLLAFKKVDAAIVSAEEIIISQSRNPENKIVALYAVFQTNPQILMARKDSGVRSLKDLFQKKEGVLAWQSGLSYALFLSQLYAPLQVKSVPYQGGISHISSDKNHFQQGFYTSEPILAENQGLETQSFLVSDAGFNPYTTVLAVHQDLLKDPKTLKALILSVDQGWKAYLKSPQVTNQKMHDLNKAMDLKTFQKSADLQVPLIQPTKDTHGRLGEMSESRWKTLVEQLLRLKLIPQAIPEKNLFTNEYIPRS